MPFMAPVLVAAGVGAETAAAVASAASAVATVASVAGTAVSAIGSIQAGNQAKATADYNAQVESQRAQIAAQQSQNQAAIDETNSRRKMGEAASAYGAAGVDMSGTPLSVMSDLATQGELTRRLDIYKGQLNTTADQQQGALDTAGGAAQQSASYLQAGSTLLTGTAKAFSPANYYQSGSTAGAPLTLGSNY